MQTYTTLFPAAMAGRIEALVEGATGLVLSGFGEQQLKTRVVQMRQLLESSTSRELFPGH